MINNNKNNTLIFSTTIFIAVIIIMSSSMYGFSVSREWVDPDTLPYCKPGQSPGEDRFNSLLYNEKGEVRGFNFTKADVCKEKPLEFDGVIILFSNKD